MAFSFNPITKATHKRHLEIEIDNKSNAGDGNTQIPVKAQSQTKRHRINPLVHATQTSAGQVKRACSDLSLHSQIPLKQGVLCRYASQYSFTTEQLNQKITSETLACLGRFLIEIDQLQAASYREGAARIAKMLKNFIVNPSYHSKLNIFITVETRTITVGELLTNAAGSNLEKLSQAKTEGQFLQYRDLFKGSINLVRIAIATYEKEDQYTKFLHAAATDDLIIVKALVGKGIIPDFAIAAWASSGDLVHNVHGNLTALGHACAKSALKVVQWLVKANKADPNFSIKAGSYRMSPESTSHFIDLHQPYVISAWAATLMLEQDHSEKKRTWSKFKGRADVLLSDGDGWMLSKCFFTPQTTPEDLHMALSTVDQSVPKIASATTSKFLVRKEAFLSATRKELSHKIALKQRTIDTALKAQFMQSIETLEDHAVKLAIVAAYHNMPVDEQNIWTLHAFPGRVSDFSNWGMVRIGDQEMSVIKAAQARQEQNEADIKLEDKGVWSAEISKCLSDSIVKGVISIIIDYSLNSEVQICNALFEATFGSAKPKRHNGSQSNSQVMYYSQDGS